MGVGVKAGFFPQDFLPIEKQRFFSHSPRVKIFFFPDKAKTFFF